LITDTELRLSFWRDGSTKAERLAAALLQLSGYQEIDPQSPLGGPDGKKDILCQKGGIMWVGAVYFPTGPVSFAATKKKFKSDLAGAPAGPKGFVFITNQTLSPAQRKALTDLAKEAGKETDLFHLQRVQNALDSAPGYGLRIQYLNIAMKIEEQLSWAVESDSQTAKALAANTRELLALRATIERMKAGQSEIIKTLGLVTASAASPDLISVSSFAKNDSYAPVSSVLTIGTVLLFHRLTCFDLPSRAVGQLRTNEVWLGNIDGKRAAHAVPPPAADVPSLLETLCDDWNKAYPTLRNKQSKLYAVANFHARFLLIHPFLDGNGRVARAVLMQQCLDLFGKADMTLMNKGAEYYNALEAADKGDIKPLAALIEPMAV
jgi:hypothetical protein